MRTLRQKMLRALRSAATIQIRQNGSESISSQPPKRDRPRAGPIFAQGEYETCNTHKAMRYSLSLVGNDCDLFFVLAGPEACRGNIDARSLSRLRAWNVPYLLARAR
jgi:hypothetical protein